MEKETRKEPRTGAARDEEGEGRKRKQTEGAGEVEEKPTDAKRMRLEGEGGGEGEEGPEQEQGHEDEKKEVKQGEEKGEVEEKEKEEGTGDTEEEDGPQPGTIVADGGFSFRRGPYEHLINYREGIELYKLPTDTTKDGKATFELRVEIHSADVLITLELWPNSRSSPLLKCYEFTVSLLGEDGESMCGFNVAISQGHQRESKTFVKGDALLDLLKKMCQLKKKIMFRVEEQT